LQLQSLKDGIVVIEMGADALPFLTTLGTLPASLAYFNFYRFTLVRAQTLAGCLQESSKQHQQRVQRCRDAWVATNMCSYTLLFTKAHTAC
jgi:hypothetical protein